MPGTFVLLSYVGFLMQHTFTLEYWEEDGWTVGQLRELPSVFSQVKNLTELEANLREVYSLLFEGADLPQRTSFTQG
jgi:predicted RNase H-like HicB family nuclease